MSGPRALALAVGVMLSFGLASSAQAAIIGIPFECPSPGLCVGTDAAESPPSGQHFLPTKLVVFDPRTKATVATRTAGDGLGVHYVRCASEVQCVALLQSSTGDIHSPVFVASFDPRTGGALNAVEVPDARLGGFDCPSPAQCTVTYMVYDSGPYPQANSFWQATFDPANAAAATRIPLSRRGDPGGMLSGGGLVCASTSRCVLQSTASSSEGSEVRLVSFDPGGSGPVAKTTLPGVVLGGLACPRADACVVTGKKDSRLSPINGEGFVSSFAPADLSQTTMVETPYWVDTVTCSATRCYAKTIGSAAGLLTIDPSRLGDPPSLRVLHTPGFFTELACLLDDRCWLTVRGHFVLSTTFDPVTGKGAPKRPRVTPESIKVTSRMRVSLTPQFSNAVGFPIEGRLTRENKVVDKGSFTVGMNQTIAWKVGRLKPGRYVASFTLGKAGLKLGLDRGYVESFDVEIAIRVTRP